ncbi:hypothetical protein ACFQ14_16195 [Pseudahrensia aquimaris]|uniref:Uncharacterized protein n=1 Tax=Pseudahrensia aquimaris TaxID=744461 RepID=A0ABW3FJX2_9HYPH
MGFFDSFHSLGYSAINVVLLFVIVLAVIFRSVGLHKKSNTIQVIALIAMMAVASVPFAMTINFLASENKRLNDAVREDGGIKQNFPEN